MKESLRPGVSRTNRIVIDRERTIGFMGEEGRVYATPKLVQDIEHTCRDLILEHCDANEDSVGINVTINHLAPTLPGMTVEITATVSAVEGRKVTFDITAKDNLEAVGAGSHSRFVVDKAKTVQRLKAKAAKLAAGQ
jgi:fluoroacetyl-CoA thioesterase